MPRIAVPDGQDPLMHLWAGTDTALTGPAAKFSDAVYNRSTLPVREFEAARITIARINDCNICQTLRTPEGPDEAFYDTVLGNAGSADEHLTERESAGRGVRPAVRHRPPGDGRRPWERLHAAFSDDELVELGLCVGSWLAFGRLNRVFDVDGACRIPDGHTGGRAAAT